MPAGCGVQRAYGRQFVDSHKINHLIKSFTHLISTLDFIQDTDISSIEINRQLLRKKYDFIQYKSEINVIAVPVFWNYQSKSCDRI